MKGKIPIIISDESLGVNEEILLDLQNKLHVWQEKHEPGVYSAAMYLDRAGTPLVAIDFNVTTTQSDNSDLLATGDDDPSTHRVRLDPSVTSTWSADNLQAKGTYAIQHEDGTSSLRSIYPILDRKTKEAPQGSVLLQRVLLQSRR